MAHTSTRPGRVPSATLTTSTPTTTSEMRNSFATPCAALRSKRRYQWFSSAVTLPQAFPSPATIVSE